MSQRFVMVGLGNPGPQYKMTRHNLGYRVLDSLAHGLGWVFHSATTTYLEAEGEVSPGRLTLLKPLTYMNLSGGAIQDWASGHGWLADGLVEQEPSLPFSLLVICDDLNLPLGSLRLRASGRSGGQNGLADIIETLGTDNFARLRLGIAPVAESVDPVDWANFVLAPFSPDEIPLVEVAIKNAVAACQDWWLHGVDYAASQHNRRSAPQTGSD